VASVNKIDFRDLRDELLPRIMLLAHSPAAPVRDSINALLCLSKIFSLLDSAALSTLITSVEVRRRRSTHAPGAKREGTPGRSDIAA
jgi:hypothetical protein